MHKNLKEQIIIGNIDKALEIIECIVMKKQVESIPFFLDVIQKTDNKILRNSLAIALSDFREQKAVPILIDLLKDVKTEGSRGTILYALEELDCMAHIDYLCNLLTSDKFELSRQTYTLIEAQLERMNIKQIMKYITVIDEDLIPLNINRDLIENLRDLMNERLVDVDSGSQ